MRKRSRLIRLRLKQRSRLPRSELFSSSLRAAGGHGRDYGDCKKAQSLASGGLRLGGFLGGRPSHLESYWSYDLGDLRYASAFLSNRAHWVRQLPGQLFHNLISHGIAKLAEFLDEVVDIIATAYQSDHPRSLGLEDVLDELRVLIRDKHGTTAFFCFSTQVKGLNLLRAYGPSGSICANTVTGSLIRSPSRSYKSYLTYFIPP
jgi:hypothetical protein